jgi:hypothetical protein
VLSTDARLAGPAKTDDEDDTEESMRTDDHPLVREAPPGGLAHRFATALAGRDAAALRELFGREVDFRGLTPGRGWAASSADALIDDVLLGSWFEPGDLIQRIEWTREDRVGPRLSIGYRLRGRNAGGPFAVAQQGFCELTDGKITWLRLLCSGFVPVTETNA